MNKTLIAVIREKGTNYRITRIDSDYATKKAYAEDCRRNGYFVTCILTVEEAQKIQNLRKNPNSYSFHEFTVMIDKYNDETIALIMDLNLPRTSETQEQKQTEEQEQAQEQAQEQEQTQEEKSSFIPSDFLAKPEFKIDILGALKEAGYNTGYIRKHKVFSESTVQKFRSGNTDISINTFFRVCQILNKDVSDVIRFKIGETQESESEQKQ